MPQVLGPKYEQKRLQEKGEITTAAAFEGEFVAAAEVTKREFTSKFSEGWVFIGNRRSAHLFHFLRSASRPRSESEFVQILRRFTF